MKIIMNHLNECKLLSLLYSSFLLIIKIVIYLQNSQQFLFNYLIYADVTIRNWKPQVLVRIKKFVHCSFNILLYAGDKVVIHKPEVDFPMSVFRLNEVTKICQLIKQK